jgi:pyrimidine oxygenase
MDFGIFLPSGNHRWVISTAAPPWSPTFENVLAVARAAEEHDFAFALSNVKLRGYGGQTRFWDDALESLTMTSALAARTSRLRLYASVAVLTVHPAIAARMAATIQDVSGGRFGLNVVSGWDKPEYAQMGLWPGDEHLTRRYAYSREYVTVMKELWEHGESDFKGEFFALDHCHLGPIPTPPISLVCAGQSDTGMAFTAEHGDYNFITAGSYDGLVAANARLRAATERTGRDVRSLVYQYVCIEDSDEAAQRKLEHYRAHPDMGAMANWTGQTSLDADGATAALVSQNIFFGADIVAGSPETVARELDLRAAVPGVGGMLLTFDDSIEGIRRFADEVRPLLACEREASVR